MQIRLGTRESALGRARGKVVAEQLGELGHEVELVIIGNSATDASHMPGTPSAVGDMAATLRQALTAGECDAIVHALKDIPLSLEDVEGIKIGAVPPRGYARDALVTAARVTLEELPKGARVGTSSLRRIAQIRRARPDLAIVDVKGTFAERVRRVEPGDLDALIVSHDGLVKMGLEDRCDEVLNFLPAAGQGALALEARADDTDTLAALEQLDDEETRVCVLAERSVLRGLEVDYTAPIGTLAERSVVLSLTAAAFSIHGDQRISVQVGVPTSTLHADRSGRALAGYLRERGAHEFCNQAVVDSSGIEFEHDEEASQVPIDPDKPRMLLPRQDGRLAAGLRDVGFHVDAVNLQKARLIEAENKLEEADWIVVPSAVTAWALREKGWSIPAYKKVAAMGDTTRQVLEDSGVRDNVGPSGTASSKRVVDAMPDGAGRHVVIPCPDDLNTNLEDGLRANGYSVERLPVVTMDDRDDLDAGVREAWNDGTYDYVLLSSPSVAHSFLNVLGPRDDVKVLAWDEPTAEVFRERGIEVAAVAPHKDHAGIAAVAQAVGVGEPA